MVLTNPPRTPPIPPEVWEKHKDTIRKLYASVQLNEVMREMSLYHDFHATVQQYKRQIAKWGLRKNMTAEDMDKIIADDCDSLGLESKPVSSRQIRRYQRRKQLKAREQSSSTSTNSDLPGSQRPQADSHISSNTYQTTMPRAPQREDRRAQHSPVIPSPDHCADLKPEDNTPSTTFEYFMKCLLLLRLADRMLTAGHNTDIRKYISSMMDATRRGAQNDLQHLQPGTSLTSFKLECDKAQAGNQPMPLVWFCDPKALDWETICLACFYIRRIGNLRASQSLELRYAPKQRTPDFRFARANTDPPAMQTHLLLYTALSMAERHLKGKTIHDTRGKVSWCSLDPRLSKVYLVLSLNLETDILRLDEFSTYVSDTEFLVWQERLATLLFYFLRASFLILY